MSNLISDYKEYCLHRADLYTNTVLDLSDVDFFHPTTLLPLAALIKEEKPRIIYPKDKDVCSYLEAVTDTSRFETHDCKGKSYLPLVALPNQKDKVDNILQCIYQIHNNGRKCGGENAFKYLIGEIVENIYEHSEFSRSWVMAQAYKALECMDICFFDDGITINGCFRKHGIRCDKDYEAIGKAINGVSTKSEERGYGLNTNLRIFTQGIQGQILIISGKGGFHFSLEEKNKLYALNNTYELSGTIISVRIPYPAPVVNIYDYLKK